MIHSVVLVRHRVNPTSAAVLAALDAGGPLPPGIIGARQPQRSSHGMIIGSDTLSWEADDESGVMRVSSIEVLRVNENRLVIVGQTDELRCTFPEPETAHWVRAAVTRHLLGLA